MVEINWYRELDELEREDFTRLKKVVEKKKKKKVCMYVPSLFAKLKQDGPSLLDCIGLDC